MGNDTNNSIQIGKELLSFIRNSEQGITMQELVAHFKLDRHTLTKYLKVLQSQNVIESKSAGMANLWFATKNPLLQMFSENTDTSAAFKSILDTIEDGITILDKDMGIIWANKKMKEMFGDNVGAKCHSKYANSDEKCPNCPAVKVLSSGDMHKSQVSLSKQSTQVTITPIKNFQGDTVGLIEVIRSKK